MSRYEGFQELQAYLRNQDHERNPVVINNSSFSGLRAVGLYLPFAQAENAVFENSGLEYAIFQNANLSGANLGTAYLLNTDLRGAKLENTKLPRYIRDKKRVPENVIIALKIASTREEKKVSIQELANLVDLSAQQVRRIEGGYASASAQTLIQIARSLGKNIEFFVDHIKANDEQANYLWERYNFHNELPGTTDADYKAKEAVLKSMDLWNNFLLPNKSSKAEHLDFKSKREILTSMGLWEE